MTTPHPTDGIRPGDQTEPAAAAPGTAPTSGPATAAPKDKTAPAAVPEPNPRGNWQLVLFLWVTSLLFLGLYELLMTFFRLLPRGSAE